MPFHRLAIVLLGLCLATRAAAFEGCNFSFRIDTQSSAFQALIEGASERGGFWRPIREAPDDVRQIAQFIGRLDVCLMTPDGKPRTVTVGGKTRTLQSPQVTTCTAALLPGNRLLTNNHCFYNDVMVEAGFSFVQEARINFGYTTADFTGDVMTYAVSTRELARDIDHDALLLQVVGADANAVLGGHVPMVMETRAQPRRALTMIHHPNGDPQQFSSGTCQVHPEQAGLPEGVSQLRHSCETTGGSSGALLLDARTLAVVGLHNQGGLHARGGYNGGHRIAAVEAAMGLGFTPRRDPAPGNDPEAEAQAALTEALGVEALDGRRAALEDLLARFPDSRAAASARFTLDLLTPKAGPQAEAQSALTEALQLSGLDARRRALQSLVDEFPSTVAARSAENALALMPSRARSREERATTRLMAALAAQEEMTQEPILQEIVRDYPGTAAARSAEKMLALLTGLSKASSKGEAGPSVQATQVLDYDNGILKFDGRLELFGSNGAHVQRADALGGHDLLFVKVGDRVSHVDGRPVSSAMDAYIRLRRAIRSGRESVDLSISRTGYTVRSILVLPAGKNSASLTSEAVKKATAEKSADYIHYAKDELTIGRVKFGGNGVVVRVHSVARLGAPKNLASLKDRAAVWRIDGKRILNLNDLYSYVVQARERSQPVATLTVLEDAKMRTITIPLAE